ncbi:MAG: acyltransferase family protein [Bacteriovoracia bacterium]
MLAPLAFYGAMAFYGSFLVLFIPKVRRTFVRLFSPTAPITQTQLKPLDSLRGMAAVGIACFHTFIWLRPYFDPLGRDIPILRQLYKSVPVFVVLSGFLIYRSIRNFEKLDDLRYYVRRRVLRIYPLYMASVLIYFALADVRPEPWSWFQRILPEVFMMKVFGHQTFIYPAYWSLYVEELFYLSMPLWVIATRRRPLLSAFIGLAIFTLIGSMVPDDTAMMKYFFIGIIACEYLDSNKIRKLGQLGAGAMLLTGISLLYLENGYGDILGQFISFVTSRFGANLVFDRPYNPSDPYQHYYTFTLGVGFGFILLGAIKFRPANWLLSTFPLRFLGTVSYSLFIWNGFIVLNGTNLYLNTMMPMLSFGNTAFPPSLRGGPFSFFGFYIPSFVFVASVSYLIFERPFLLLRGKKVSIPVRQSS